MLRLSAASKRFHDDGPWVLKDIELTIPESSFFCLLGPSGCGKSTILNMIAGFEAANSGTIVLRNRPIVAPGPDRFVIFQEAGTALFSWLNVRENIEFGMRVQGRRRAERHPVVDRYLSMVGLSDHGSKFPDELSGGMKQRLQLARALALEPRNPVDGRTVRRTRRDHAATAAACGAEHMAGDRKYCHLRYP